MESSSSSQIDEYQNQLLEINQLLEESPNDESLVKLKNDLLELIQLTTNEDTNDSANTSSATTTARNDTDASAIVAVAAVATNKDGSDETKTATATGKKKVTKKQQLKKQKKLISATFEIPSDLLPLPSDTEAIRLKKRRKIKALKSNFRSKQKHAQTDVKQRSWADFRKKTKTKKKSDSIFRTEEGIGAKVGVISGIVSVAGMKRQGKHQKDSTTSTATNASGTMKRARHTF